MISQAIANVPSVERGAPLVISQGYWKAGAPMSTARQFHTNTLLENGTLLVVGGTSNMGDLASVERYDPARDVWP